MNRLLILRGGALGDFVLTVPVFAAIRKAFPGAGITLVAYPHATRLAQACGLADETRSLDDAGIAGLFAPGWKASSCWQELMGSCDTVVSYLHDPGDAVRKNLLVAGAKKLICASPLVTSGHAVDHLLEPLARLGIPVRSGAVPWLAVPASAIEEARKRLTVFGGAETVVIHPGSGSAKKNWPIDNFLEFARRTAEETGRRPLFLLGEAELPLLPAVVRSGIPVLHGLDIVQVAAVLSCAGGYVGNDSGITHLAAAVGTRVVALFGPTDPVTWGPRGDNVRIISIADATRPDLDLTPLTLSRVL